MLGWSCYKSLLLSLWWDPWWACYQEFGLVWIMSGPLVDGTTSRTLFSRLLLGQWSASVSTVGLQTVGLLPDMQMNVAPSRSLGGLLSGHWICPLMGRMDSGPWPRGAGTEPQSYFRFYSQDWGLVDLALESWMGMAPLRSLSGLECPLTVIRKTEVVLGSLEVQTQVSPTRSLG